MCIYIYIYICVWVQGGWWVWWVWWVWTTPTNNKMHSDVANKPAAKTRTAHTHTHTHTHTSLLGSQPATKDVANASISTCINPLTAVRIALSQFVSTL